MYSSMLQSFIKLDLIYKVWCLNLDKQPSTDSYKIMKSITNKIKKSITTNQTPHQKKKKKKKNEIHSP